jgi:hypothetical protein
MHHFQNKLGQVIHPHQDQSSFLDIARPNQSPTVISLLMSLLRTEVKKYLLITPEPKEHNLKRCSENKIMIFEIRYLQDIYILNIVCSITEKSKHLNESLSIQVYHELENFIPVQKQGM